MENDTQQINLRNLNSQPLFRIKVFDDQEYIDFRVMGKFHVEDDNGNVVIKNGASDLKWRVKIKESRPGKEKFFLVLFESFDRELVEKKLIAARRKDPEVELRTLGGETFLENRKINDNTKYILTVGNFATEMGARKAFKRFQPEFIPDVEKSYVKEPDGHLEIFDAEYDKSAELKRIVRIVPADVNTKIKMFGIKTFNDILQKDNFNDLVYNGTIEFRLDVKGNLMGISEIPLESYLKRVIYSEIGSDLPLELSKSLAIVCRSEAMARINHQNIGEDFDYRNTGQTLRYFGDDFDDETIEKAVEVTSGQVIVANGLICDTPFHLISGGHTEDASLINDGNQDVFFRGKYDWKEPLGEFSNLQDEKIVKKWIYSRPDTWCNLKGRKVPLSLERVKRHFRWELNYSRRELEDMIRRQTGEDIGILFEIMPLQRGRSGRLKEIELIGSLKNYRIRGELNIRSALAHDLLPSSCFLVEREMDETGTPISFTLVGAGHGHGVGMCKTGAAVMALENYTSKQILDHYFESCKIRNIYT